MNRQLLRLGLFLACTTVAFSHPMGNFSVSHYSRLDLRPNTTSLIYVLDLAEIPTFQLLQEWGLDGAEKAKIAAKVKIEAANWLRNLDMEQGHQRLQFRIVTVSDTVQDGAGAMPVLRVSIVSQVDAKPGELTFKDNNYPNRTGWKQIVIRSENGATISDSTQGSADLTDGLTKYPAASLLAPPQELEASVHWTVTAKPVASEKVDPAPTLAAERLPSPVAPARPAVAANRLETGSFALQQPNAAGTVVKGDFLSRMLRTREISFGMILIGIAVAFGLGAIHALSPGHGKTIVAAYLVGNRGTAGHALFLGAIVTTTHTASVFLLGLGVLFLQQYIVPDRIIPWLGAISGLSIVAVGVSLLYGRSKALLQAPQPANHHHDHGHHHEHDHAHPHKHEHVHVHTHEHASLREHDHSHDHQHDQAHVHPQEHAHAHPQEHEHVHSHAPHHGHAHDHHRDDSHAHSHDHAHDHDHALVHSHGGTTHSHLPVGKITPASLIALGVSGGLVPCPSALVLMLSAIALGHAALGLMLLVGFSLGLALVLMAIGLLVIYAKNLLPDRSGAADHPFFRLVPVFSSVVVICLGLGMTAVALGLVSSRFAL